MRIAQSGSEHRRSNHRRRAVTVVALVLAALLGSAPAAAAHVAVDAARPNGDGTTTITLAWDHSCTPEAATTGVDVAAGAGVTFTGAATAVDGWTFSVEPNSVSFAGPGVLTGQKVSVEVVARIDGAPGATIIFPAIQHCGAAQSAWTDPDPAAEHPSPNLIATAALLAPAAVAQPASGADITQVLTGIAVLAAVLGAVGFLAQRGRGDPSA